MMMSGACLLLHAYIFPPFSARRWIGLHDPSFPLFADYFFPFKSCWVWGKEGWGGSFPNNAKEKIALQDHCVMISREVSGGPRERYSLCSPGGVNLVFQNHAKECNLEKNSQHHHFSLDNVYKWQICWKQETNFPPLNTESHISRKTYCLEKQTQEPNPSMMKYAFN